MKLGAMVLLLGTMGWAQPTDGPDRFDVAAIKISAHGGGGMGSNALRIMYNAVSIRMVMMRAFDISPYRILGPDWLSDERYSIDATIPEGTTPAQSRVMLQNLLVDRFHLKFRREKRELLTYQLVVDKGGPKMTELKAGTKKMSGTASLSGITRPQPQGIEYEAWNADMASLAGMLSISVVHDHVDDKTGLTGKFAFTLHVATESGSQGGGLPYPSLSAGLADLGLKLIRVKAKVDVIVVESADKLPTEN
ncbi:MAG: TIGR03435 family protein [Bryobacteraceae bacterium]